MSGGLLAGFCFHGRQESINEGVFKCVADSRVCGTGGITGYEDCKADVVVWREDEAGVVHTDVAVFGVEVCDAIVGVLDADYFPRSTDGCVRVGSVSHWF